MSEKKYHGANENDKGNPDSIRAEYADAISMLEEQFKTRVLELEKRLALTERKLRNAKYVAEASEALVAEAQLRQVHAESRAARCNAALCRLMEANEKSQRVDMIAMLRMQIKKTEVEKSECEMEIQDSLCDPLLELPAGTAKRKQLQRTEKKLGILATKFNSKMNQLNQLEAVESAMDSFFRASNDGDKDTFEKGIRAGLSVNTMDETGYTAFHLACGQGHVDIAKLCIGNGADLSEDNGKVTALTLAVSSKNDDLIRLLLNEGADANGIDAQGKSPLHVACRLGNCKAVRSLVEAGAEVKAIDKMGNTPLHEACRYGRLEVAKLLLRSYNADPSGCNMQGQKPINYAYSDTNGAMIALLNEQEKNTPHETEEISTTLHNHDVSAGTSSNTATLRLTKSDIRTRSKFRSLPTPQI